MLTTLHYLKSLKCILSNKRGTNPCAIALVKAREMLQGAAPQSRLLGPLGPLSSQDLNLFILLQ